MHKVAAVQMVTSAVVEENLDMARELIAQAANEGAELVVLPEDFAYLGMRAGDRVSIAEVPGDGQIQRFLSQQAQKNKIWLVGGTIPIKANEPNRSYSSCLVFDDQGRQQARYDKVHLFDAIVADSLGQYQESKYTVCGREPVVVDTPVGRVGLAVCYDIRFAELFRYLAAKDVDIFAFPAAFTAKTGEPHWEVLVRARAIENLSYIVASAQGGKHQNGRDTYGHSMIVDPWGTIINEHALGPGIVVSEIDSDYQKTLRQKMPVLQHRKLS